LKKNNNTTNVWDLSFSMQNGTVTSQPVEVVFDENGKLLTPREVTATFTADNGDVNVVTVDISGMTQYAGDDVVVSITQDGRSSSALASTYIDSYGVLQAEYKDGHKVNLAKLAVVAFDSPENLIQQNGTMFEASNDTGMSYYLIGPDTVSSSVLTSQAVESSPVNLEKEFSNLVIVQRAYTLNTTSFSTHNEMLQTAVDILS